MTPCRHQRRRGYRLPAGVLYVGRPTRWGNPYRISDELDAAAAVARYRAHLAALPPAELAALLAPLRGRDLACWCALDAPCHADVLLEVANINLPVTRPAETKETPCP